MLYRFCFFASSFLFLIISVSGQPVSSPFNLYPPLKGELNLSGSFGEVRTNSFHAGIDFRTGSKIGLKVYSSDDGYVSRVRVGGTGFGKAIYIQHPNGLTTVYAHLDKFTPEIDLFVKEQQYQSKSFEIDLAVHPKVFPIKRGQHIGFTGNTGSSGGPHLHYEVRLTSKQTPLNPAFSNLPIKDNLPPVISSAFVYPKDSTSLIDSINAAKELNVQFDGLKYRVIDTIMVSGTIGLGIKAYDYINKNSLRCGVYSIKMLVNNVLYYHFSMDEFSFAESRYANAHIDYAKRQTDGKRIHKLHKEPNNLFSGYKTLRNNGNIKVFTDSIYNVNVIVEDSYGNSRNMEIVVKGTPFTQNNKISNTPPAETLKNYWLFYKDNGYDTDWFKIFSPKNSLYDNIFFSYSFDEWLPGMYSPVINIHKNTTPIHRSKTLSLKADSVPNDLLCKALIATLNSKGEIESVGGNHNEGYIETQIQFFGSYFIAIDTLPPSIKPQNIFNGKVMSKESRIQFLVEDDLSGIASIQGTIDNNWSLFEYDPKNKLVFYEFDKERLKEGVSHSLVLSVKDSKGNERNYKCQFFW
jgi:murein DD-endopeptidase MepM/ murein hydrolase activator NlpD